MSGIVKRFQAVLAALLIKNGDLRGDFIHTLKGKTIHFDDRYLHVELEDGRIILTPMTGYKAELDYHLSIQSMMIVCTFKKMISCQVIELILNNRHSNCADAK